MLKEFDSKRAQLKYAQSLESALSNVRGNMSCFVSAVSELENRIRTRRRGSDYQYYDNRELLDECNNYKAQVKGGILHLTGLDPENKRCMVKNLCLGIEVAKPEDKEFCVINTV